jgi:hypothetical protein
MIGVGKAVNGGILSNAGPLNIPGCVIWLRSDMGITLNGSNQVTNWADQSGFSNHAFSFGALQPYVLKDPAINNLPSIQMNKVVNGSFFIPYNPSFQPATFSALSYFVVYRYNLLPQTFGTVVSSVFSGAWTDGWGYGDVDGVANNTGAFVSNYLPSTGLSANSTSTSWRAAVVVYDGITNATVSTYHNNVLFAQGSRGLGNVVSSGNRQIVISGYTNSGGNGSIVGFVGMDIAEFGFWTRNISNNELSILHSYSSARYGLP